MWGDVCRCAATGDSWKLSYITHDVLLPALPHDVSIMLQQMEVHRIIPVVHSHLGQAQWALKSSGSCQPQCTTPIGALPGG